MAPRKTILRELARAETGSGVAYVRPPTIPGFSEAPEKYQRAVNELLSARLLEGRKDEEGRMTIAINEARRADVRREIRPMWANPIIWVLIAAIAAVGTVFAL